ncbi:MAG: GNAT family N-acetyltransferase [Nanoarchaeales archaeon]|nr:GNAT family N-acetyltransferase [Nanoarchaeales archaeon]
MSDTQLEVREIKEYSRAFKIIASDDRGKEIGHAMLYLMQDESHTKPIGYFSNLLVDKDFRGAGIGSKLAKKVISEAERLGCYKLLCSSRDSRGIVDWYKRLGYRAHSTSFRIDFCDGGGKLE